jgi:hypothetical protein
MNKNNLLYGAVSVIALTIIMAVAYCLSKATALTLTATEITMLSGSQIEMPEGKISFTAEAKPVGCCINSDIKLVKPVKTKNTQDEQVFSYKKKQILDLLDQYYAVELAKSDSDGTLYFNIYEAPLDNLNDLFWIPMKSAQNYAKQEMILRNGKLVFVPLRKNRAEHRLNLMAIEAPIGIDKVRGCYIYKQSHLRSLLGDTFVVLEWIDDGKLEFNGYK